MNHDAQFQLIFRTDKHLYDSFYGRYHLKRLKIYPFSSGWNYTLLSCFLNENGNFVKASRRAAITTTDNGVTSQKFTFMHKDHPYMKIFIDIDLSGIHVSATTSFIRAAWTSKNIVEETNIGVGRKILTHSREQIFYFYEVNYQNPRDGTKALYLHTPLLFNSHTDFSRSFNYFCKKVQVLPKNSDTVSITEYTELWIHCFKTGINDFDSLGRHINGYLKLNIQPVTATKRLPEIVETQRTDTGDLVNSSYYIVSGVYLSPWGKSFFEENPDLINGLMLDTTWKVMSMFVTSIVMGSAFNVGIPLGFAFGHSEDKALYVDLIETMQQQFEIDIKGNVLESDQGSALKAAAQHFGVKHIMCLRHLLVSLKFSQDYYLISLLIKCTSITEFNIITNMMSDTYKNIVDQKRLQFIRGLLKKIGFKFENNVVSIADKERWESVSLLERIPLKMPSTTNSLESTHGHMNAKVPRNNNFYMSIYHLVHSIMMKSQNIQESIERNYARVKNETNKQVKRIENQRMLEERSFYNTTFVSCDCGENKLTSALLGIDIPCSHRVSMGAPFQPCPIVNLSISQQWKSLIIDKHILPAEPLANPGTMEEFDKNFIKAQIKRFSKYKNVDEISSYVEEHYKHDGRSFVGHQPFSVINMITEGSSYFQTIKYQQKYQIK